MSHIKITNLTNLMENHPFTFIYSKVNAVEIIEKYAGEIIDEFHLRWNNYKSKGIKNARIEACMKKHLLEHFKSKSFDGFLGNVSIKLIDKTDGKDPKRNIKLLDEDTQNFLKTVSEQSYAKV